jgi:hypothetical protein
LKDRYDGCRAALQLAMSPPGAGDRPSPRLLEMASAYVGDRPGASVEALHAELVQLDDQLTRASRAYAAERAAWREAVHAEARRLAEELRPVHKQACRKIARAVEVLSAAVEEERKVRARLLELGCDAAMPDGGKGLGTLSEFNSALSTWNRHALAAGLLDT